MPQTFRNNQSGDKHLIELIKSIDLSARAMMNIALKHGWQRDRARARDAIERAILVIEERREIQFIEARHEWSARILRATKAESISDLEELLYKAVKEFRVDFHSSEGLVERLTETAKNVASVRNPIELLQALTHAARDLGRHGATKKSVQNHLTELVADLGMCVAELDMKDSEHAMYNAKRT